MLKLAKSIEKMTSTSQIVKVIEVFSIYCPSVASWVKWWTQDHIVKLLACKSTDGSIPNNTNIQESLNSSAVHCHHGNGVVEAQITLREDISAVGRYLALTDGCYIDFKASTKAARQVRSAKRVSKYDGRAPDSLQNGLKASSHTALEAVEELVKNLKEADETIFQYYAGDDEEDQDYSPSDNSDQSDCSGRCLKVKTSCQQPSFIHIIYCQFFFAFNAK